MGAFYKEIEEGGEEEEATARAAGNPSIDLKIIIINCRRRRHFM